MANNSIKSNARRLYLKVKQNISEESKTYLDKLLSLSGKELYEFRDSLMGQLDLGFECTVAETAKERNMDIDDCYDELVDNVLWGNQWDCYIIALELLGSNIENLKQDDNDNHYDDLMFVIAHNLEKPLNKIARLFNINFEVIEFFLKIFDIGGEMRFSVDIERARQILNGEVETDLSPEALKVLEFIVNNLK